MRIQARSVTPVWGWGGADPVKVDLFMFRKKLTTKKKKVLTFFQPQFNYCTVILLPIYLFIFIFRIKYLFFFPKMWTFLKILDLAHPRTPLPTLRPWDNMWIPIEERFSKNRILLNGYNGRKRR